MVEPVAEAKLVSALLVELQQLEESAAVLPLALTPAQGWFLLGFLQLALRQPGVAGKPKEVIMELARDIERRMANGRPAMQEAAKRGWMGGETAAMWGAPAGPPPDLTQRHGDTEKAEEPEEEKRKPEVTPQNKQVTPPENKGLPPKKRKPQ